MTDKTNINANEEITPSTLKKESEEPKETELNQKDLEKISGGILRF